MSELKYSQEDLDNILAKKVAKLEEKFNSTISNEYISKSEFAKLQTDNSALRRELMLPKITSACKSAGLKPEAQEAFLKLNKGLFECKEEDLQYNIEKCRKEMPFMFNNSFSAETGNQPNGKEEPKPSNVIQGYNSTIITRTK